MIIYNGPFEEPVENPTEEFLKEIIFNKDEKYWKKGCGESSIEIDGFEEMIIFFYQEPYGFFVMRHPDYLVTINDESNISTIIHVIGGEPMKVPTCSFVSRDKAYKIISSLLQDKKAPSFVKWVDLYDINFEHGF